MLHLGSPLLATKAVSGQNKLSDELKEFAISCNATHLLGITVAYPGIDAKMLGWTVVCLRPPQSDSVFITTVHCLFIELNNANICGQHGVP